MANPPDDRATHRLRSAQYLARRTGLFGRSARALAAVGLGAFVYLRLAALGAHGSAGYRDPSIVLDLSLWFLTAILVAGFVDFAGRFVPGLFGTGSARGRAVAVFGLTCVVVVTAAIGLLLHDTPWGFPLADVWWWFNTVMLTQIAVAFALATWVGTPGCEQGVWRELIGRSRQERSGVYACIVGLHRLDEWEWRRIDRRAARKKRRER
ncbi:MAG: hypothetical protein ACRDSE_24870 [Pseudonocardiaceae bacterium]